MEITLLTVVYAGLQTAFGYRGRVRYLLVCLKTTRRLVFQTIVNAKKITPARPAITVHYPYTILLGTTNQRFSKRPALSRRASLIAGFSIIVP